MQFICSSTKTKTDTSDTCIMYTCHNIKINMKINLFWPHWLTYPETKQSIYIFEVELLFLFSICTLVNDGITGYYTSTIHSLLNDRSCRFALHPTQINVSHQLKLPSSHAFSSSANLYIHLTFGSKLKA